MSLSLSLSLDLICCRYCTKKKVGQAVTGASGHYIITESGIIIEYNYTDNYSGYVGTVGTTGDRTDAKPFDFIFIVIVLHYVT